MGKKRVAIIEFCMTECRIFYLMKELKLLHHNYNKTLCKIKCTIYCCMLHIMKFIKISF